MKLLWTLFIAGQILNAGNMNYQQEIGYSEFNPIYGSHPDKKVVYLYKTAECLWLYSLTKMYPKYEKPMLVFANSMVWGMIINDNRTGIAFNFRW